MLAPCARHHQIGVTDKQTIRLQDQAILQSALLGGDRQQVSGSQPPDVLQLAIGAAEFRHAHSPIMPSKTSREGALTSRFGPYDYDLACEPWTYCGRNMHPMCD